MTGRASGYCILRESKDPSNHVQGFAGVQGTPVDVEIPKTKEVMAMPPGGGVKSMVGRSAMYPGWGNANPLLMGAVPPLGFYQPAPDTYRRPWWGSGFWWAPFARAFGCGRGGIGFPW